MGFTRPALRRAGFALKFNQEQKQVLGESDPQQRKHDPLQAHTHKTGTKIKRVAPTTERKSHTHGQGHSATDH